MLDLTAPVRARPGLGRAPGRAATWAVALAAGLATGGALAGLLWPALAPVGLAVLASCLPRSSPRQTPLLGAVFAVGFVGVTLAWLWPSIGPGAWLAVTLAEASFVTLAVVGMRLVVERAAAPLWAAAIWTTVELGRSAWPLGGLPWGRLAYAAPDTVWAALLPWVGVSGTSLVMAAVASWIGFATARREGRARVVAVAAGLLLTAAGAGPWAAAALAGDGTSAGTARVAVVQGGVPGNSTDLVAHHREVTERQGEETARLASSADARRGLDFVLWPENSTAVDPSRDPRAATVLDRAVTRAGTPLLAGVVTTTDAGAVLNQGVVWTGDGAADRYTKQHLVPFGEYVPWRSLAERVSSRVAAIERDMTPGAPTSTPLRVGNVRVANALCFDVAYGDVVGAQVRGGAELVTLQTSNAMFAGTAQPEQQWTISRVRALEVGRSVVVASVNGISGAIAPDGEVIARLSAPETASAVLEVPLRSDLTWATRVGAAPSWVIGALGVIGIGLGATARGRRRR